MSVADDGGSSGRLRRDLGVLPPGDLRRCLVALADDELWAAAFEHRFGAGELDGHALGNLMLVGLTETLGDFTAALDDAGRLLGSVGRVLPATTEPVVLKAEVGPPDLHDLTEVEGQVAVQNSHGIRRVELVPADAPASPDALPRSPRPTRSCSRPARCTRACCRWCACPGCAAPSRTRGAGWCRWRTSARSSPRPLASTAPTTCAPSSTTARGSTPSCTRRTARSRSTPDAVRALGVTPAVARVARPHGLAHDPQQLAKALHALL